MNIEAVIADFRHELRTLERPGELLEALPLITRRSMLGGEVNDVCAYALDEENADAEIATQCAHFRDLGRAFEWKVFSFDAPSDLLERLGQAGFEIGGQEALVVYDLEDGLAPFKQVPAVEVRRITRLDQLPDFKMVSEGVFGKDFSLTTNALAEAISSGQTGHDAYVAYVDGHPASVGRIYTDPRSRFAGLYGGGTLPEYRRKGIYGAVVAARAHHAAAEGIRYLQVDAMATSLPILERAGFVRVADTWPCLFAP